MVTAERKARSVPDITLDDPACAIAASCDRTTRYARPDADADADADAAGCPTAGRSTSPQAVIDGESVGPPLIAGSHSPTLPRALLCPAYPSSPGGFDLCSRAGIGR